MATFKVGQRVKVVSIRSDDSATHLIGRVGTVIANNDTAATVIRPDCRLCYAVSLDGHTSGYNDGACRFAAEHLVPLTDPGADAFLESIRKLKPLHEDPQRTRVVVQNGNQLIDAEEFLRRLGT